MKASRVSFISDLASLSPELGDEAWVEEVKLFYKAVPGYDGGEDGTAYLKWQPFGIPSMTTTQKEALTASGTPLTFTEPLIVYDLTLHKLSYYAQTAWYDIPPAE